jgi:hypothetical protein
MQGFVDPIAPSCRDFLHKPSRFADC